MWSLAGMRPKIFLVNNKFLPRGVIFNSLAQVGQRLCDTRSRNEEPASSDWTGRSSMRLETLAAARIHGAAQVVDGVDLIGEGWLLTSLPPRL